MGLGKTPAVFVSSTCYDLKQIRADIKDFIEKQLGYEAVLSDYDSFPLAPDIGTVENCLRAVKERADIFILVVGGRYGSLTDTGKSVTNLEYIHARAQNIPIYVFINKEIVKESYGFVKNYSKVTKKLLLKYEKEDSNKYKLLKESLE